MALATTAAVAVGSTAAAAYLDAKFHVIKDITTLRALKSAESEYQRNASAHRVSCLYFFEEVVAKHPDAEAIWSREGVYTWKEAQEKAHQYAAYFLEHGVKSGDIIALCMANSPDFFFAWLGLWAIGCAPAMINSNLTGDALIHCLKISGAKLVLVDNDGTIRSHVTDERQRIEHDLFMTVVICNQEFTDDIGRKSSQRPDDIYRDGLTGDFPAGIFYTSGTTGFPKGSPYPMSRLHMTATRRGRYFGQTPGPGGDRWYICMPLYHGTGGITAITCLMAGISVAIGKGFSARNFWRDVHDSEATTCLHVGEAVRYLLAAPPGPFDRDHRVRSIYGNGLRPDVWEPFRERFSVPEVVEFFNSSEGMFGLLNWNKGDYTTGCVGHHGGLLRAYTKNIFVPVAIDYETGEIIKDPKTGFATRNAYEEGGEILVALKDKQLFPGYWNNPDATANKLIINVFKKGDLYYRTGDALRRTKDGRWFFMDRLGDTYRWKSENVSTADVAEVFGRIPGIYEANVYGVQVPGHEGKAGCAALSIAANQRKDFDWTGLVTAVKERLPRYAVPVFIRVLSGETGAAASHNNKQDKVKLRAEGVDPRLRGTKVPGGDDDEMFWLLPKGIEYVPFKADDWQSLMKGSVRL